MDGWMDWRSLCGPKWNQTSCTSLRKKSSSVCIYRIGHISLIYFYLVLTDISLHGQKLDHTFICTLFWNIRYQLSAPVLMSYICRGKLIIPPALFCHLTDSDCQTSCHRYNYLSVLTSRFIDGRIKYSPQWVRSSSLCRASVCFSQSAAAASDPHTSVDLDEAGWWDSTQIGVLKPWPTRYFEDSLCLCCDVWFVACCVCAEVSGELQNCSELSYVIYSTCFVPYYGIARVCWIQHRPSVHLWTHTSLTLRL